MKKDLNAQCWFCSICAEFILETPPSFSIVISAIKHAVNVKALSLRVKKPDRFSKLK